MAYTKKTWMDRNVEHPSRRKLTPVSGEENVYDVTRSEGGVTTPGDAFNAENMNDLETRISEACVELQNQIDTTETNLESTQKQTETNKKSINTLQGQIGSYKLWSGTESQYNALTKDANTLYFITE